MMNRRREKCSGETIIKSIALLHDRSNGLGGGFAAYGIYPELPEHYALHIMADNDAAHHASQEYVQEHLLVEKSEPLPTRPHSGVADPPQLWRYFVLPRPADLPEGADEADVMIRHIMTINQTIEGAFVFSSGKNMGAFKAVGYAEDIGQFFRLDEYEGWTWIAHGRFPTNTPGWWGGAHPFTLLDWAVVHNGEISSYGINKRYLEGFGYQCTLLTDTEVMAYLLDLLVRKHGLSIEVAADALAAPFWKVVDRAPEHERELLKALRMVYGPALVNGPFAIIFGHSGGMVGFNDRIKLRPMVAAEDGDTLYIASEEAAIREICPSPERVWTPKAGEPVVGWLEGEGERQAAAVADRAAASPA
ncbi:MAG: glutamine amidotransferase family protein [Armatimonadota bacterium]